MSPWLSGWQYRKSHEIIGSPAGAQTDYQIKIRVVRSGISFGYVWDSGVIATGTALDTARNIVIDGNYLYAVSNTAKKLVIYDISNPSAPVLKSTTSLPYGAVDVRKKGNYLFVSCANGVQVWNVSNVEAPTLVTTIFNDGYYVHGMFLSGNYLYCCRHQLNKFVVVDVSNPESPVVKGSLTGTTYFHGAHDVYVDDANNLAYVTNYLAGTGEYGITVVDISNKDSLAVVTGVGAGHKNSHIIKMGSYLYVGTHDPDTGLTVWNVSNPSSPSYVGRFFSSEGTSFGYWMAVYDSTRFVAICTASNKLYLIDVSNPSSPVILASILVGSTSNPANVAIAGEYFYVSWTHESSYGWHITSYKLVTLSDSGDTVYVYGKCRADFGDIRFTDYDGITELPYWIEEKVDGDYAIIWVKVPSIPASPSTATIYVYYGKSDATTTSNGDNTFVFFDDFDGSALDTNKWNVNAVNTITYVVADGKLKITDATKSGNTYWIYDNTDTGSQHQAKYGIIDNVAIEWKSEFLTMTTTSDMGEVGLALVDASNLVRAYLCHTDYLAGSIIYKREWIYETTATFENATAGEIVVFKIVRIGSTVKFYVNDILKATGTLTGTPAKLAIAVGAYGGYSFAKVNLLWVRTRKFVDPEPSHGAWGSEETLAPIETIISHSFPMEYISKPIKAQMLVSKVEGASITKVTKDFPEILIKKDKAQELRSKFS